jgi:hypothetical protein
MMPQADQRERIVERGGATARRNALWTVDAFEESEDSISSLQQCAIQVLPPAVYTVPKIVRHGKSVARVEFPRRGGSGVRS